MAFCPSSVRGWGAGYAGGRGSLARSLEGYGGSGGGSLARSLEGMGGGSLARSLGGYGRKGRRIFSKIPWEGMGGRGGGSLARSLEGMGGRGGGSLARSTTRSGGRRWGRGGWHARRDSSQSRCRPLQRSKEPRWRPFPRQQSAILCLN
jgi:hypothetical protein